MAERSQGGSEEIFESVGDDSGVSFHISSAAGSVEDAMNHEDIDLTSVDPSEAFAAFNGKIYVSSSSASSTAISISSFSARSWLG